MSRKNNNRKKGTAMLSPDKPNNNNNNDKHKKKIITKEEIIIFLTLSVVIYIILLVYSFSVAKNNYSREINVDKTKQILNKQKSEDKNGKKDEVGNLFFDDYLDDNRVSVEIEDVKSLKSLGKNYYDIDNKNNSMQLIEISAYKEVDGEKTVHVVGNSYIYIDGNPRLGRKSDLIKRVLPTEIAPTYYSLKPPTNYSDINKALLGYATDGGISDDTILEESVVEIAPSCDDDISIGSSRVYITYEKEMKSEFWDYTDTRRRTLYYNGFYDRWEIEGSDELIDRIDNRFELQGTYSWKLNLWSDDGETDYSFELQIESDSSDGWKYKIFRGNENISKATRINGFNRLGSLSGESAEAILSQYDVLGLSNDEPVWVGTIVGNFDEITSNNVYLVAKGSKYYIVSRFEDEDGILDWHTIEIEKK